MSLWGVENELCRRYGMRDGSVLRGERVGMQRLPCVVDLLTEFHVHNKSAEVTDVAVILAAFAGASTQ